MQLRDLEEELESRLIWEQETRRSHVSRRCQVVFKSQKFSVLVIDCNHTKMNIHPESGADTRRKEYGTMDTYQGNSDMESNLGLNCFRNTLDILILSTASDCRKEEASEYGRNVMDQILDPELPLDPIDGQDIQLAETIHLDMRITNDRNTDCKVHIDNKIFNCHLIVLQCYSEVFNEFVILDNAEFPSDEVSIDAFAFIYKWMLTEEPIYLGICPESFLDIFKASIFLKVLGLTKQCWAFLNNPNTFSEEMCFLLYKTAKQKDVDGVGELMLPRIQKFFLMLVSSQDWLDIDKDDAVSILSSSNICVNCEMEVFMSAIRWLEYRWEEREEDLIDVMNCVRFGNIAQWQLVDLQRELLDLTVMPALCRMIDNVLLYMILKNIENRNSSLSLQRPPPRNWSGVNKRYFTYREFLDFLYELRVDPDNQMIL